MAYYKILLNLGLLDLSRFVGFNFGLIVNSEVRTVGWESCGRGVRCERPPCTARATALPCHHSHGCWAARSCPCCVHRGTPMRGERGQSDRGQTSVYFLRPPFIINTWLISSIKSFVVTKLPACQAGESTQNLLMLNPWELKSLLFLAGVTPVACVGMKLKEQKVLCEVQCKPRSWEQAGESLWLFCVWDISTLCGPVVVSAFWDASLQWLAL